MRVYATRHFMVLNHKHITPPMMYIDAFNTPSNSHTEGAKKQHGCLSCSMLLMLFDK